VVSALTAVLLQQSVTAACALHTSAHYTTESCTRHSIHLCKLALLALLLLLSQQDTSATGTSATGSVAAGANIYKLCLKTVSVNSVAALALAQLVLYRRSSSTTAMTDTATGPSLLRISSLPCSIAIYHALSAQERQHMSAH
jgi:hypothetical protein